MPVYKYLDLSTAHVTEEEMRAIEDKFTDLDNSGPRVIVHDYGAWVNVNLDPEIDASVEIAEHYPHVAACMDKARELGCNWINFDQDAATHEGLPVHDW